MTERADRVRVDPGDGERRGENGGPRPVRTVDHLEGERAAVGQARRVDAVGPVFGDQAGDASHGERRVAAGAADELRVRRHRRRDPRLRRARLALRGPGDPAERAREAEDGRGEQWRAAAVERRVSDRDAGEPLDLRPNRALQRVRGVEVVGGVPAGCDAGGEHRGVLARAVLGQRARVPTGELPLDRGGRSQREVRSVLQVGLGQAGTGQEGAHARKVDGLTRVARTREGQPGAVHVESRAHHRRALQRLERRSRPDDGVGLAEREPHGPVGREHDEVT